jgi:SAM-dependent methyltransferase
VERDLALIGAARRDRIRCRTGAEEPHLSISHRISDGIARLGLRKVPPPPPELAPAIGMGDFYQIGRDMVRLIDELAGVAPDERIVDVGCGLGRLVQPLRSLLDHRGRYDGVDIVKPFVEWDRQAISSRDSRFRFHHLDLFNTEYNREGKLDPATVRFPFADGSFSLAIATSLFTHLQADAAANYLREIARLLRPGGRLFATFFLLDPTVLERIGRHETDIDFAHAIPHGRVADAAVPEKAIAFDVEWVYAQLGPAGLEPGPRVPHGGWTGLPGSSTYQDVVVATRV